MTKLKNGIKILDFKCSVAFLNRDNNSPNAVNDSVNAIIECINNIDYQSQPKPHKWEEA